MACRSVATCVGNSRPGCACGLSRSRSAGAHSRSSPLRTDLCSPSLDLSLCLSLSLSKRIAKGRAPQEPTKPSQAAFFSPFPISLPDAAPHAAASDRATATCHDHRSRRLRGWARHAPSQPATVAFVQPRNFKL